MCSRPVFRSYCYGNSELMKQFVFASTEIKICFLSGGFEEAALKRREKKKRRWLFTEINCCDERRERR